MFYYENKVLIIEFPEPDDPAWDSVDELSGHAFTLARSNFPHLSIYLGDTLGQGHKPKEKMPRWNAYAFRAAASVFIDGEPVWVFANSILISIDSDAPIDMPDVEDIFWVAGGIYSTEKNFGSGDKEYTVTAVLRDEYTLNVKADSEEDAVKYAMQINISDWKHEEIEPHLEERVLLRMARWGNLTAKEVK